MGGQTEKLPAPKSGWSVKLILLFFVVRCLLGIIVRTYFAFKTVVAAWLRDSSKDLISCRPTILLSPYRQYVGCCAHFATTNSLSGTAFFSFLP